MNHEIMSDERSQIGNDSELQMNRARLRPQCQCQLERPKRLPK